MKKSLVKYRTWYKGIPPRPIKMEISGWAGNPGYGNGCKPQPWHCKPFVDASTYGLELIYPWDAECIVTCDEDGVMKFDGDFSEDEKVCNTKFPPFMTFAPNHYGFTSSLDIETEPGNIVRIEPHPRFYTDTTGEVPIPVAGHIEAEWWSRIFFVVFKCPRPGERHVFRKGEAYAQILILPTKAQYEVRAMTTSESHSRNVRDANIATQGEKMCTHKFKDDKGNQFNNKYKVLSKLCERNGVEGVDEVLNEIARRRNRPIKKIAKMNFKRIRRRCESVQMQETGGRRALQDIHQEQASGAESSKCPFHKGPRET